MKSNNLSTDEVVAGSDAGGDREREVTAVVIQNLCNEPMSLDLNL